MRTLVLFSLCFLWFSGATRAEIQPERSSNPERERARIQNRLGWEAMRAERWAEAAAAFGRAIEIDPSYEYAYYGLGRAELGRRNYQTAIAALEEGAALYEAQAGRQFANVQDAQRYRRDQLLEIDEHLRQLRSAPPSLRNQDLIRQLENLRREISERIERGNSLGIQHRVPSFMTLSLGSAYFRAGRLADAERQFKETIATDPKSGEAFNNLAVVYLETGRIDEANEALRAARKTGFRVNPQLERAIQEKRKR